ncbi:nucleoporin NUP82, partial [Phenoliferia sp. Uapishka_3]
MSSQWLDLLPHHPIFDLPAAHSLTTHSSIAELARPPSPALSSIFGKTTSSHNNPNSTTKRQQKAERDQPGGRKSRAVIARGTELVVAVGRQLRIASLLDVKARCEEKKLGSGKDLEELEREVQLGEYKVLNTPIINFDIQQLILNSTSKLLAVVGQHSIAIVLLPRRGWTNSIGSLLETRALLIGRFYHSLPGSPNISQVSWHPWGDDSSSLMVLTTDAILREYSINEDTEEPAQTVSFCEKEEGRGMGTFSSEDRKERKAVAFCVGGGVADWGPLTVYGLMESGDVVALCPFLPKKAAIPASYLHSLSSFVSAKVDILNSTSTSPSDSLALALTHSTHSNSNSLSLSRDFSSST